MGFLEILLLVGWFALLMLSIMAYFFFRRKFAYTKAIMEFVFIAAVLIFSVAVKAVVWGVNAGGTLTLSKFFEALYTGIGGLTFEGLPDAATGVGKEVSEISLILFYGAPLYAGIMTLFILSARASYEFYSKIRLKFVLNKNIYIITDLSEETIKLAESIRKGDKKSLIVFAGPRIAVFDRKNELCRRVMSNGMLYWSYAKKKKIKDGGIVSVKSIAASLSGCFGFGNKGGVYRNVGNYKKRIRVFAFASENHIPLESENIDTVYDDVCTRIEHKDSLRIEYYILIRDKIDYPAYQKMVDELKEKFVKNSGMEKDKFNDFFNIKCWCEADMIGLQSFETLIENNFLEELKDNKPLYMWSIGFGSRGEAIAREIYIKTANVECQVTSKDGASIKFIPRKFFAEVFDKEAERIGGIFRANHPNYLLVTKNEENKINNICKAKKNKLKKLKDTGISEEDINTVCRHIKSVGALFAKPEKIFEGKYNESLPKPIYRFRQTDCREFNFFDIIDKETGKDCAGLTSGTASTGAEILKLLSDSVKGDYKKTKVETQWKKYFNGVYYPKVIVVATGDDDLNIQIANTVIQDVLQESNTVSQYLLVHIADKNNNHRVIKPDSSYLKVLTVGNFNDIYQYKYISDEDPSRYHFTYERISDKIKKGFNAIGASEKYIIGKTKDDGKVTKAIRCFYALTEKSLLALKETLRVLKEKKLYKKLYKNIINDFQKSIDQLQQSPFYDSDDWNGEILKIAEQFVDSMLEKKKGSSEKNTEKRKIDVKGCYDVFNTNSLWKQYSNLQVCTFASVLGFLAKQTMVSDQYDFRLLSAIEHDRWVRLHMAFGWIYGETKDEMKKMHHCLKSYREFGEANQQTVFYDLMNVVWAIIDSKEKSA